MFDDNGKNPVDLEQFNDGFATTQVDTNADTDELPDGKYQMVVEKVELQRSQKGNAMLVWRFRVLGPRYAGRKHWHRNMIVSKENLRWLKHDLVVAGLELAKLSELPNRVHELFDVVLEVQIKKKGTDQHTYINKRVRASGAGGEAGAAPAAPDDFPF